MSLFFVLSSSFDILPSLFKLYRIFMPLSMSFLQHCIQDSQKIFVRVFSAVNGNVSGLPPQNVPSFDLILRAPYYLLYSAIDFKHRTLVILTVSSYHIIKILHCIVKCHNFILIHLVLLHSHRPFKLFSQGITIESTGKN